MSESDKVFSEQEVAALMKRAVELQEANLHAQKDYRPGVTRDELVRAAREIGVDPSFLEQALREKLQGKASTGSPLLQEEQRVVEGEIDPNDFDLVLKAIRPMSSRRHPVTQVGRTLLARSFSGSGIARVEVTSRGGRTRINVKPFPVFEVIASFYPAFIVSMITGSNLSQGSPGIATAVAGGVFALAALVCRSWLGRSRQAAIRLADRIQDAVSDQVASQESAQRQRLAGTVSSQAIQAGDVEQKA